MIIPDKVQGADGRIFNRQTIVDSAYALSSQGHDAFDRALLIFGLALPDNRRAALPGRANSLASFVLEHPDALASSGSRLDVALVGYAGALLENRSTQRRVLSLVPKFREQLEAEDIVFEPAGDGEVFEEARFGFAEAGDTSGFNSGTFNSSALNAVPPSTFSDDGSVEQADNDPNAPDLSSSELSATISTVPISSSGGASGGAIVNGVGASVKWPEVAPRLLDQLNEIDEALKELLPVARYLAANRAPRVDGIGHNNPPPDFVIEAADLEEVEAAVAVTREQLQSPAQTSANALRLSAKVFQRVGALAEWALSIGKMAVEEYGKAAAQQAGKRTVDAAFYLKVLAAIGIACLGAAALIHTIPI